MIEYNPDMTIEEVQAEANRVALAMQQYDKPVQHEPTEEGDFSTILSSAMISDIVNEYFKKLYRAKVHIVDLKPTADGYLFVVAFDKVVLTRQPTIPPVNGTIAGQEFALINQPNVVYPPTGGTSVKRSHKKKGT